MKTKTQKTKKPIVKKPAPVSLHKLFEKLKALAERGVNGEAENAKAKIAQFLKRYEQYDFTAPVIVKGTKDMFFGSGQKYQPAFDAHLVWNFGLMEPEDMDIANACKWAIENATGIHGCFRNNGELWLYAAPSSAVRLGKVIGPMAEAFKRLWWQYRNAPGANPADRGNFMLGLYEGMMNEVRSNEALPTRAGYTGKVKLKARKNSVMAPPGMALHPYSVAVPLGRQIRFCAPIETISAELEQTIKGELADHTEENR